MKVVIQRVSNANVKVENKIVGAINKGLLLFVGVLTKDTLNDVDYLVRKIVNMRIFEDENGKMNLSLKQLGYEILSISQFTLAAELKSGNRPSFSLAANPEIAQELYNDFNNKLINEGINVQTGQFGSMMDVSLVNDGPVTIIIDSKNR